MRTSTAVLIAATAVTSLATSQSPAQSSGEEITLSEVVVTAERRAVDLQKSSLNITAITADDLEQRGIHSTRDLLDTVPGFNMTVGNVNTYIGLFGLQTGPGDQRADGVMTFNYGGIPLARQIAAGSSMYDLDRVEVLKGPQGTLYGRNATVGALNLVLKKPTFGDSNGEASVTRGNYGTLNTSGAANLPISDRLAARVAFQTTHHDGYFTNGLDDANNMGVRASLLWQPNENFSVLFLGDFYRDRSKGPGVTFIYYFNDSQKWVDPANPWFGFGAAQTCANQLLCPSFTQVSAGGVNTQTGAGFADTSATGNARLSVWGDEGHNHADQDIYSLEANYKTGIGTLTVQAARVNTQIDLISFQTVYFSNLTKAYQNSLEVRMASDNDRRLRWLVGGFYFREHQDARQDNLQGNGWAIIYTPNLVDQNYAGFGDLTFSVTDRFRLLAGIRYTNENKSQDGWNSTNGVTAANMALYTSYGATCYPGSVANPVVLFGYRRNPSNVCLIPNSGDPTFNDTSYKTGVELDLGAKSMLYATYKTGFRSGGFTAGTNNTFRPEKLKAIEVGSRSRFLDDRLQFNTTVFHWDYDDEQLAQLQQYFLNGNPVGQASFPFNVDSWLEGLEADLQALVTRSDRVGLNLLYSRGKLKDTPAITNSSGVTAALHDIDRYNLPDWTITGSYHHLFAFRDASRLDFGVNGHYVGKAVLRLDDPALLTQGDVQDAYTRWDANLTYTSPGGKWTLEGYMKNLTDEATLGTGASGQIGRGVWFRPSTNSLNARVVGLLPPRTYGVRVGISW